MHHVLIPLAFFRVSRTGIVIQFVELDACPVSAFPQSLQYCRFAALIFPDERGHVAFYVHPIGVVDDFVVLDFESLETHVTSQSKE
jgi:hypothetical protein